MTFMCDQPSTYIQSTSLHMHMKTRHGNVHMYTKGEVDSHHHLLALCYPNQPVVLLISHRDPSPLKAAEKKRKKNSKSETDGGAYDDYDEEDDEFDYKEDSPPKPSKKKNVEQAVEEEEIELKDDDGHQEL